ncbi:hypothetical protein CLU79DRAFT_731178 [Phycomyces nitens]|nr:hypothetical protein CLU79DRAFT_731178 [Phycomyces nitens]
MFKTTSHQQSLEYNHTKPLKAASKRYRFAENQKDDCWTKIKHDDPSSPLAIQLSKKTSSEDDTDIYKAILEYPKKDTDLTLDDWRSIFDNPCLRLLWDQQVENHTVLKRPSTHTFIVHKKHRDYSGKLSDQVWVEKSIRKKKSLKFISAPIPDSSQFGYSNGSTSSCLMMGCTVQPEMSHSFVGGRVTLYYEQSNRTTPTRSPETYLISLLTSLFTIFDKHGSPPYIQYMDNIILENNHYDTDSHIWKAVYKTQPVEDLSASVGSITIRSNNHSQWNSHLVDRSTSLPLASLHHKNSFMTSSLMFSRTKSFGTHPLAYSPETHARQASSATAPHSSSWQGNTTELSWEGGSLGSHGDSTCLEIAIERERWFRGHGLDLTVKVESTGSDTPSSRDLSDRYAHLCIRYLKHPHEDRYWISISHPPQLSDYLMDQADGSSKDSLDDIDQDITVTLELAENEEVGPDQFLLNGNVWPIRTCNPRTYKGYNSSSSSSETETEGESDEDEDMFVDGMEEIGPVVAEVPVSSEPDLKDIPVDKPSEPKPRITVPDIFPSTPHVPTTDPPAVLKANAYLDTLLDSTQWKIAKEPADINDNITIKHMEIPGNSTGVFLSQSTWQDCSIWDAKAVFECVGAQKIWDNTLEDNVFLYGVSPTCSLWQTKIKGNWTQSALEYITLYAQYVSAGRIDLCATSYSNDSYNHHPLPKEKRGVTRASIDLAGWRIERLSPSNISVKYVHQAAQQGWVPPWLVQKSLQSPILNQKARFFFEEFGAPPNLESLVCGKRLLVHYDHEKTTWRAEYSRPSLPSDTAEHTLAVIRLDHRRWANGQYRIVVDPPPSSTKVIKRWSDPSGVWLKVEHEEEFIIPQRGKILIIIKPQEEPGLTLNGSTLEIEEEEVVLDQIEVVDDIDDHETEPIEALVVKDQTIEATNRESEETPESALAALGEVPVDQSNVAIQLLKQIGDQEFGWTLIGDKNGLKINKRQGEKLPQDLKTPQTEVGESEGGSSDKTSKLKDKLKIHEPFMIYKASKVIEGFSLEEVASVVTELGNLRKSFDESVESTEIVKHVKQGCNIVHQTVKSVFPFKSREMYQVTCTATETLNSATNPSTQRVLHVESSLVDFPVFKKAKYPRGRIFLSGWILEPIDPYTTTTNHPIPSIRATYVVSMDLGPPIPSYISNFLASGLCKQVQAAESYLKKKGPPPFLVRPSTRLLFENNALVENPDSMLEQSQMRWTKIESDFDKYAHRLNVSCCLCLGKQLDAAENTSKKIITSSLSVPSSLFGPHENRRPSQPNIERRSSVAGLGLLSSSGQRKVYENISPISMGMDTATYLRKYQDTSIVLSHIVLDLQRYPKGYEITCHLNRLSIKQDPLDISDRLTIHLSKLAPEPSHLIVNEGKKTPKKHSLVVKVQLAGLLSSLQELTELEYDFLLTLEPVKDEYLQKSGPHLTVAAVLGEDDDQWDGVILVNGREVTLGSDIKVKHEEKTKDATIEDLDGQKCTDNNDNGLSDTIPKDSDEDSGGPGEVKDPTMAHYVGGSVVAAAFDGVSAGVNGFYAHMPFKFRASPSQMTTSRESIRSDEQNMHSSGLDRLGSGYTGIAQERTSSPQERVIERIHMLSLSSIDVNPGSVKKIFLILVICVCIAIVLALLMLQPLVRSSNQVSLGTGYSLDGAFASVYDSSLIHRLWSMPWFGNWEIQIIAIRRNLV